MASFQIQFHEAARDDISDAERHYSSRSLALGRDFIDAIDHAIARLRAFPESGSRHSDGSRRLILERFPFNVMYTFENTEIVIVAVAHQRRKPGYWRQRL